MDIDQANGTSEDNTGDDDSQSVATSMLRAMYSVIDTQVTPAGAAGCVYATLGMPIVLTRNKAVATLGLANGTRGYFVGVGTKENAVYTDVFATIGDVQNVPIRTYAPDDITAIFMLVPHLKQANFRFQNLPTGVVPIFRESYSVPQKHAIPLQGLRSPQPGKVYGPFKQFPLVSGLAVTVFKAQGLTVDRTILTTCAFPRHWPGALYVALSRHRGGKENIQLMQPLKDEHIVFAQGLTHDLARLQDLDEQTTLRIQQSLHHQ